MSDYSRGGLNERQALMILSALPDFGPITVRRAQENAGCSAAALFSLGEPELRELLGARRSASLREWERHFDLEKEEKQLAEMGGRYWVEGDPGYPELLTRLVDAPLGIYQRGPLLLKGPAIAVVGTRHATQYGRKVTRQLVSGLVRAGFTIVSGLALGIDTEAHQAALDAGGKTIAVLGNGIDRLYPPQNRKLFAELDAKGAILSEFYLGRQADRQTFPQRNRIVSGMSHATLVVETAARGGSLITARFAMEQNRIVFVVPGRIDQPESMGCLELIRDGASLVRSVEDILDELRFMQLELPLQVECNGITDTETDRDEVARTSSGVESPELESILQLLKGASLHPDQICERSGLPPARVHSLLMLMELRRWVARNPNGTVECIRR